MKIIKKLSLLLNLPASYRLFRSMVGGESAWRTYLAEYVKPAPGDKILDIGCGPADVLNYLPAVNYTGLDISPEYICSARKRFGARGRFCCGDVGLATIEGEQGTFDLVLAIGMIHHLDDAQAARLFDLARLALRPTGRLVTYDGCYVPQQSHIARWLLAKDRGKFVRTREEYLRLALARFSKVELHLRHDLLRIPYTHLIMCCCD
ncbi:MAG: class I SAM-dependent methyltransferase [Verrucomicrobiota bacterium]